MTEKPVEKKSASKDRIVFYCKDCEAIVGAKKELRRYVYKCDKCNTKNVAFGTEKSIKNFYHVEEEDE